jgi:hypothetical protein
VHPAVPVSSIDAATLGDQPHDRTTPLIIRGGARDWPATQRWTPAELASRVAGRRVPIAASRQGLFDYVAPDTADAATVTEMPFDEAVRLICDRQPGGLVHYLQQGSIPDLFPELRADLRVPDGIDRPELIVSVSLWLGAAGCVTKLHYDMADNYLVQVQGRKRFLVFNPDQHALLYAAEDTEHGTKSRADFQQPDEERFPLLRQARPMEAVVEPGDILYLPAFWWHEVETLEAAISVNYWWKAPIVRGLCPAGLFYMRGAHAAGGLADQLLSHTDSRGFASSLDMAQFCLGHKHQAAAVLIAAATLEAHLLRLGAGRPDAETGSGSRPTLTALAGRLGKTNHAIDVETRTEWGELVDLAMRSDPGDERRVTAFVTGVELYLAWNPA